jgi:hypothetical protein
LSSDEAFVFQLVEGGVKRPVADLESLVGHLAEPLGDGPTGARLEIENLEDKEEEGSLDESGRAAHGAPFR